jgi:hypothetical protein
MSPDAVRNTLDRITETPFTQFLIGVGKQRSAMPIRHAQAPNEPPAESGPTLKAGDASDSNPGTTQATG